MTTRALEELDGGLGSCPVDEDLSGLADLCPGQPREDRARGRGCPPSETHLSLVAGLPLGSALAQPVLALTAPRSPARKKSQASPPPRPPPPPPALSEELPWGDLSLNKCLVLASLVALLGSACQLCREAVAGEAEAPAPVPEPWVPPSSAPKEPALPLPKPVAWAPPLGQPQPQAKEEERAKVPGSREAAGKDEGESEEAAGEERVPLTDRGPKERPKKERPPKEKPRKEERPRKERPRKKPRKEERPRAAREPREALPRRWEAREGGHRPWARDPSDSKYRKTRAWASAQRQDEEDRSPGRQKQHAGKGRD
uniref:Junctional sarcoplasmic reticulum protein 1 n=1 Tax=Catagonus wagneri TaxID=51154 RepID=A0A8C3WYA5_9CETA